MTFYGILGSEADLSSTGSNIERKSYIRVYNSSFSNKTLTIKDTQETPATVGTVTVPPETALYIHKVRTHTLHGDSDLKAVAVSKK